MAVEPETHVRAFIAFELPEEIVGALTRIQTQLRQRGLIARWVRPENIHLTLRFLGNVPGKNIDAVGQCMQEAARGRGSISLAVKGLGVFPGLRRPRVLWAGLDEPKGELIRLHGQLEACLESLGWPRERRPFKGHLTLGRFKQDPSLSTITGALEACRDFSTETFGLDTVALFQSDLRPSGPVYTKLLTATL